ncbi:MAG: YiaA/YiaB family inner membrane protein [Myxococcota bacterium]
MQREIVPEGHTPAWNAQVWIAWIVSAAMTLSGIYFLPVDAWVKGYLLMGTLFTVGSSFTLSKTVRDNHEAYKLRNRISKAKANKLLHQFEEEVA